MYNSSYKLILLLTFSLLTWGYPVNASEEKKQEGEFTPGEFILDHIADAHEWHILTKENGEHVSIPLPVILYSNSSGLHIFMSGKLAHGHTHNRFKIDSEGVFKRKIVEVDIEGRTKEQMPLDFSITKNVASMLLSMIIMLWMFSSLGRSYKKRGISAPKGMQGFLEPIILFIRDDIAIPNIGKKKYNKYMSYLLTVFFFILINNFMGLIPLGANVTGNIAVTFVLALFTLIIILFSGNKDYWMHIVATPGVPVWLAPIMVPVEVIGMFAKPFALMIRLFANITAGHIIILSLVSLVFIFKSIWIAPVSVAFVLFMNILELLVALLQAYIFTLLSALFIGLAVTEHH